MNIPAEFDDIRPYTPEELPQIFEELLSDKDFQAVIQSVMPNVPLEMIAAQLRHCKTNLDVQKTFFHKLLHDIMQQHSDGFDMDASSLPDKNQSYTFISNHRDIVLDPGFLSVGLLDNGFPTTVEIAIGDNLLIYPWIKKLVRVNKSFIVQRALSMRQMLESSARMSRQWCFAPRLRREAPERLMLPSRAGDELFHKALRGEGDEVVDALAHADEPHRQTEALLDGYHAAALGRAVELGQHDARQGHDLAEQLGLADGVLSRRRVEDQQRFMRRAVDVAAGHAGHLPQLFHEV